MSAEEPENKEEILESMNLVDFGDAKKKKKKKKKTKKADDATGKTHPSSLTLP